MKNILLLAFILIVGSAYGQAQVDTIFAEGKANPSSDNMREWADKTNWGISKLNSFYNSNTDTVLVSSSNGTGNLLLPISVGNIAFNEIALQSSANPPSNEKNTISVWNDTDTGNRYLYYTDSDSANWFIQFNATQP